jgi:hypothetical protein
MSIEPGFAYAQPRLQARHGQGVSAPAWSEAETSIDLGRCLQVLRSSPLRPWIAHLTAQAHISDIERHLRDDWRDYVNEVSGWAPPDWKPSLQWLTAVLYLPLLGHLIEGFPAPQWLSTDSFVPGLAASEAGSLQSAIAVTALAPLARVEDAGELLPAWIDHWRSLMPARMPRQTRTGLAALERAALDQVEAAATSMPGDRAELRNEFRLRLQRLFRRHALSAVALFSHLALTALDVERLRGALIASRLRGIGARA